MTHEEFVKVCSEGTEKELRDATVPFPKTSEELTSIIKALESREHDYGTCVYAMSIAATVAFNYIAHVLGTTGFQSGCADLDVIRRTRGIEGPFMLLRAEDDLYPQSDPMDKAKDFLESPSTRKWVRDAAEKKIAEHAPDFKHVHPNVRAHWERIVRIPVPEDK